MLVFINFSECVFVTLVIYRTKHMLRICVVFCDLSGSIVFLHINSSTARFSEYKLRNI